jgi:hypothetical protein
MSPVVSECGSSRKDSCTIRALSVSVSRTRPRPLQSLAAAGHDHRHLVGEAVSSRRPPRERPFAVPIDALATSIRGMLAG